LLTLDSLEWHFGAQTNSSKRLALPGFEPGSSGSQPLMLTFFFFFFFYFFLFYITFCVNLNQFQKFHMSGRMLGRTARYLVISCPQMTTFLIMRTKDLGEGEDGVHEVVFDVCA
jgi:hypothetical protein